MMRLSKAYKVRAPLILYKLAARVTSHIAEAGSHTLKRYRFGQSDDALASARARNSNSRKSLRTEPAIRFRSHQHQGAQAATCKCAT